MVIKRKYTKEAKDKRKIEDTKKLVEDLKRLLSKKYNEIIRTIKYNSYKIGWFVWIIMGFLLLLTYPLYSILFLFIFGMISLILGLYTLKKNRDITIFLWLVGTIVFFIYFSYTSIPEKTYFDLSFYNWDKNQIVEHAEINLDFRKACGGKNVGEIRIEFRNEREIKSYLTLELSEPVDLYYLEVTKFGGEILKNISGSNSSRVSIFNGTKLDIEYYRINFRFNLNEDYKPKMFLALSGYPQPDTKFKRVVSFIKFNSLEYECEKDCINTNFPYKSIKSENYPVNCINFPYSFMNILGLKSAETDIYADTKIENEVFETGRIWMHINLKEKRAEIMANIFWAIIVGLIIFVIQDVIKNKISS